MINTHDEYCCNEFKLRFEKGEYRKTGRTWSCLVDPTPNWLVQFCPFCGEELK